MRNFTSNLYFASILIILISLAIWFVLTNAKKTAKQSILSKFTDVILSFAFSALGINALLNIHKIVEMPYQLLFFSSNAIFLATLFVMIFHTIKYGEKLLGQPKKSQSVAELFLLIGLINHMYLYFLYSAMQSIIFIIFYLSLLLLLSFTKFFQRLDPLLILFIASTLHVLLMRGRSVLYLNFAFDPLSLSILMLVFISILFIQRRNLLSKPN